MHSCPECFQACDACWTGNHGRCQGCECHHHTPQLKICGRRDDSGNYFGVCTNIEGECRDHDLPKFGSIESTMAFWMFWAWIQGRETAFNHDRYEYLGY